MTKARSTGHSGEGELPGGGSPRSKKLVGNESNVVHSVNYVLDLFITAYFQFDTKVRGARSRFLIFFKPILSFFFQVNSFGFFFFPFSIILFHEFAYIDLLILMGWIFCFIFLCHGICWFAKKKIVLYRHTYTCGHYRLSILYNRVFSYPPSPLYEPICCSKEASRSNESVPTRVR